VYNLSDNKFQVDGPPRVPMWWKENKMDDLMNLTFRGILEVYDDNGKLIRKQ
jgi:hypothetical protein